MASIPRLALLTAGLAFACAATRQPQQRDPIDGFQCLRSAPMRSHWLHAAWSRALQVETESGTTDCESPGACYLTPARTAVISSPTRAAEQLRQGWLLWDNTTAPRLPDELIDEFKLRCGASVSVDPGSLSLASPVLATRPDEYTAVLSLSDDARRKACGLLAMTDVARDDEGRGLVVIQLWAAHSPNPFQWAVLLQRNGDTWDVMASRRTFFDLQSSS